MTRQGILEMLKTVRKYHNVEMKFTSSSNEQIQLAIRGLKNSGLIEITNLTSNLTIFLDDLDKATETIQTILNEDIAT